MSFCPNCGSPTNDGAKFCRNCGSVLPAVPVKAVQPQPVYQQPVQMQPQPVVIQQPVVQPAPQNTVPPTGTQKEKTNGLCSAGFVLSLLGLFLFGITSLFGLIFSVIGLISANKKKQKGKGKAIAGIIMATLMIIAGIAVFFILRTNNPVTEFIQTTFGINLNHTVPDYVDYTVNDGWVLAEDESYIEFDSKHNSVKYCVSYHDTGNYYINGRYEIYTGKKAADYLTVKLGDSGVSERDLDYITKDDFGLSEDNLLAITCHYDEYIIDGKTQDKFQSRTTHLYGFYTLIEQNGKVFDAIRVTNIETGKTYTLIRIDQYADYVIPEDTSIETIEETTEYDETGYSDPVDDEDYDNDGDEYDEPDENYDSYDGDILGDALTGTVLLTQGEWETWTEADESALDDYISSRHQMINVDTETLINLTAFNITVAPDMPASLTEGTRDEMETEGITIIEYGETVIGGYKAYMVTGQYQDGMYLTVMYFTDDNGYLHFISVEYYPNDTASYEMVKDTYTLS